MTTPTVAAMVVTYFPDDQVHERLDGLREQIGRVAVVDNGSDDATLAVLRRCAEVDGVTLQTNGVNLGVAKALNQGLEMLADEGFAWVLTMDQDSSLAPGCVEALTREVATDVALVGANRRDPGDDGHEHRWLRPKRAFPGFERVPCDRITSAGVTLVITSGTLVSTRAFREIGPFRDDYFVDMVDFEFCLRARRKGYRVLVSCAGRVSHRVGIRSAADVFGLTVSPTHHLPLRRYYLFRNAVVTLRGHGRAYPHWTAYQILALGEVVLGIVVAEDAKLAKLRACWLGLWDGLLDRLGPARRAL